MSTHLLGSTVLMAVLVVAVFVAISRIDRRGQRTDGLPAKRSEAAMERAIRTANSPGRLGALFVAGVLVAGALTLAAVGGLSGTIPNAFVLVVALFGVLFVGFLFVGSYVVVRQHGLGHAQGVAAGLLGVGGAGILLVAANLVFGLA